MRLTEKLLVKIERDNWGIKTLGITFGEFIDLNTYERKIGVDLELIFIKISFEYILG